MPAVARQCMSIDRDRDLLAIAFKCGEQLLGGRCVCAELVSNDVGRELDRNVPSTGVIRRERQAQIVTDDRVCQTSSGVRHGARRVVSHRRVIRVLHLDVKTQGACNCRKRSVPVTCRDGGQRSIAVALGRVFSGKDVLAECDQFEATSRGARNLDAPVPTPILFEYVEGGEHLTRCG